MNRLKTLFLTALFALFIVGLAPPGLAQSSRGSIAGSIVDGTGAAVPNAKIIARNPETGVAIETKSTGEGNYKLSELPAGVYTLTVTAGGFKTAERTAIKVDVNTTAALDIALEAGQVTDTVSVVADAPTVQTESSDIGTVVRSKQFLDLPPLVNGVGGLRSPEAFVFLTPGTVGPGTATDPGATRGGGGQNGGAFQSKISGSQNFSNEVLIEGASMFRSENGSSFDETAMSVESVQEFKVQTSTLPAEYGRTGGGITSFAIKSGTNEFHGDIYDFYRNRALNANSFFNNARGLERRLDNFHNYGGTIGGPIYIPRFGEGGKSLYSGKNRGFFFFAYEGFRRTAAGARTSTLPLTAWKQGDFSSLLTTNQLGADALGRPIFEGAIYDPATTRTAGGQLVRDAFAGNRIPANRFSQVARNVLALIPDPNLTGRFDNFAYNGEQKVNTHTYTIKLEHAFSDRNRLSGSYSRRDNKDGKSIPRLPDPLEPDAWNQNFITNYYRLAHDFTFSPSVLNHLNLGLNRTLSLNPSRVINEGWADKIGLKGAGGDLFPRLGIQDITAFGNGNNANNIDNGFRLNDNVSAIKGSHSWKFGVDYRYQQYTPTNQGFNSGNFGFGRAQTAVNPNFGNQTGFGFASFLLGAVGGGSDKQESALAQWRSSYFGLFVQDDWKVAKNLVFNIGLRWDVDKPRRELHNRFSSFDPTLPNPGADNRPGALAFASDSNRRFADTWYKDFGPRIGFAWSPDKTEGMIGKLLGGGKTVIRGGYGIYYQPLLYAEFGERLVAGFAGDVTFPSVDGFEPAFYLDQGVPQKQLPRGPTIRNYGDIEFISKEHGRPPMIQNWSLEVQRELARDMILTVGYVGTNAHHLHSNLFHINSAPPDALRLGDALRARIDSPQAAAAGISKPFPSFPNGETVAQALRPFPQYRFINTDCCLENLGNATYNSLQVKLERRFSQGLNLLAAYTFSKTITDADSALPIFATFSGGGEVQNPYNLRAEKAISNQDVPHSFVTSFIYELPIGEGKALNPGNKVVSKIVSGWQFGGVARYLSGQPYSFRCANGIPGVYGCVRFDRVAGQDILSPQAKSGNFDVLRDSFFNRAAFADPNANRQPNQPFRFGSMARTTSEVRTPAFLNEDISLIKKTRVKEEFAVEFRAEFFNIFNRAILSRAIPEPYAGDFGRVYGTATNPRTIQFGLKLHF